MKSRHRIHNQFEPEFNPSVVNIRCCDPSALHGKITKNANGKGIWTQNTNTVLWGKYDCQNCICFSFTLRIGRHYKISICILYTSVHSMYSTPEISGVDLRTSLYSYSMNRRISGVSTAYSWHGTLDAPWQLSSDLGRRPSGDSWQ